MRSGADGHHTQDEECSEEKNWKIIFIVNLLLFRTFFSSPSLLGKRRRKVIKAMSTVWYHWPSLSFFFRTEHLHILWIMSWVHHDLLYVWAPHIVSEKISSWSVNCKIATGQVVSFADIKPCVSLLLQMCGFARNIFLSYFVSSENVNCVLVFDTNLHDIHQKNRSIIAEISIRLLV